MREFHRHPVEAPSLALAHTYKARPRVHGQGEREEEVFLVVGAIAPANDTA